MSEVCLVTGEDGIPFIRLGKEKLRLELEDLDDYYKEMAQKQLGETPERVEEALKTLRDLLAGEPDIKIPLDDKNFLIKFLRPCKFYPKSTFKLMTRFYKYRVKYPKYCNDLLPSKTQNALNQGIIRILPRRDADGRRILVIQAGHKWDTKKCTLEEIYRITMMALEAAIIEPVTQVAGVIVILDMEGLTLTHVCQFTPGFAKALVDWIQECLPIRLRAIHIINQRYIFNMLFALFKPFLIEKLRQRIFFHGTNYQDLVNSVGAECIPTTYGGKLEIPEMPGSLLYDLLLHYENEYKQASQVGYINLQEK